jgi:hypothetical protein
MDSLAGNFSGDFEICGVRADFNFVCPRNLPELANVNFIEKRFVLQRRENTTPDRIGQVHHTRHAIRVVHADFVTGQRGCFYRSNHDAKVPLRKCGVKVQAIHAAGMEAVDVRELTAKR